ncbi:PmoA family protein [Crossiella sp. S99.2]|nr:MULTISPECIES: DUF6807 family protein [unclassified Crossiella]MCK2244984.1 PmoA family protein [Crossiella sp. S99.2]MCK2258709.1 PmoA family protein [Crossiella sp. S99.1]
MREIVDRVVRACPAAGEPWLVADNGWVRVHAGRIALADYVLGPAEPYLHPLRTTAGELVTGPGGLRFSAAEVSGENVWGGRTPPLGGGMTRHVRWERVRCHGGRAELWHWLDWRTRPGQRWLAEDRAIEVDQVDPAEGFLAAHLENPAAQHERTATPVGRPALARHPFLQSRRRLHRHRGQRAVAGFHRSAPGKRAALHRGPPRPPRQPPGAAADRAGGPARPDPPRGHRRRALGSGTHRTLSRPAGGSPLAGLGGAPAAA